MKLKVAKGELEIIANIVNQWYRTGELSVLERALVLGKLRMLYEGIESGTIYSEKGSCADSSLMSGNDESAVEVEKGASESEAKPERDLTTAKKVSVPVGSMGSVRDETGMTGDPVSVSFTIEQEADEDSEPTREALIAETPQTKDDSPEGTGDIELPDAVEEEREHIRRRRLDKNAIRSLYDADYATEERKVEERDTVPAEKTGPGAKPEVGAILPKKVLGEVINNDRRVIGENLASQCRAGTEKITALKKAIGVNDKYLIIRDLFDGDAEKYEKMITELEGFADLNDAVLYLHDNYRWNHTSEGAKLIVDLLTRKLI